VIKMALDTQENLIKTVIDYSHRGDLGTKMEDFITLAETEMLSNPIAPLKLNISEEVSTVPTTTTSRLLALPSGFQSSRKFSIAIDDSIYVLKYRTPSALKINSNTGAPCFFTIRGSEIEFDRVPDKVYTVTFTYFAGFQPLTTANQTNIVLTKYPNIYLYGCLRQVFLYTQDTQQASIYANEALSAVDSANKAEKAGRYGPQLQMSSRWAP
jgi:hypothetical protein